MNPIRNRVKAVEHAFRKANKGSCMVITCIPDEEWYPDCGYLKLSEAEEKKRKAIYDCEVNEDDVTIITFIFGEGFLKSLAFPEPVS